MTREEAIKVLERAEGYIGIHYINGVEDPYIHPCLLKAIDFAISSLRGQEELRWIPVNDRLPKEDGFYRVYHKNSKAICDRFYYKDCPDLFVNVMDDPITHWKPIEHPPK